MVMAGCVSFAALASSNRPCAPKLTLSLRLKARDFKDLARLENMPSLYVSYYFFRTAEGNVARSVGSRAQAIVGTGEGVWENIEKWSGQVFQNSRAYE
jgi:hypothetical protein